MSNIGEKVAEEILIKPTSGVIDALIGPKLEKLKRWSEEKDLEGQLDPNKLSIVLRKYLLRLSERVSTITTIAFPRQKLNISEAYEPLQLLSIKQDKNTEAISLNASDITPGNHYILIDNAGMGKSTFSKYLIGNILFKCDRIPILYELRNSGGKATLIDDLVTEFDEIGEAFSRTLFYKLIQLGKFIIILDGFDEIGIDEQDRIAKEISDLSSKGMNNSIVLTSRNQGKLPDLVKCKQLSFQPLNISQARSLALRYDKFADLEIGANLFKEIHKVPDKFLETPLLVSLLYRTYGFNGSIAKRIATFYDEIYDAFYKGHDLTKAGFSRDKKSELDFEDFRKLLRAFSFLSVSSNTTAFKTWTEATNIIDKASNNCSIKPKNASFFLEDLLTAVPLMIKDGTHFKFIHKTIQEFFAAEYIIYSDESSRLADKIFRSSIFPAFKKTFEFLEDMNSSLYRRVVTKKYAEKVVQYDIKGTTMSRLLLSAVTLFDNLYVGVWKLEDVKVLSHEKDGSTHQNINLPDTPEPTNARRFYYGDLNAVKYVFALASRGDHYIMSPTWNDITEDYKYKNIDRLNNISRTSDHDFNSFSEVLPLGKWHSCKSEIIRSICNKEFIQMVLSNKIAEIASSLFGSSIMNTRFISIEKCKKLLEIIAEEEEAAREFESFFH